MKEEEALLEQCYIRLEKGEAPDEMAEKTWLKTLRDEQRRKEEKSRRAEVLHQISYLCTFVYVARYKLTSGWLCKYSFMCIST